MPKMILANPLIDALIERGIISPRCNEFILHAKVGHPIMLTEGKYLDDAILEIAHGIRTTELADEARA